MAGGSTPDPPYMHPSLWDAFEHRDSHHPHYNYNPLQSASSAPGPGSVCLPSPFMDVIHEEHRFEIERTAVKTLHIGMGGIGGGGGDCALKSFYNGIYSLSSGC